MFKKLAFILSTILVILFTVIFILAYRRGDIHHGTIPHLLGAMTNKEALFRVDEMQRFLAEYRLYFSHDSPSIEKGLSRVPKGGVYLSHELLTQEYYEYLGKINEMPSKDIVRCYKNWYPHISSGIDPWGNPVMIKIHYSNKSHIECKDGTLKYISSVEEITNEPADNVRAVVLLYTLTISSAGMNRRNEKGKGDDIVRIWDSEMIHL